MSTEAPLPATSRVSPDTTEMTDKIISVAPSPGAPAIAPDIPVAIDPGPTLGVARAGSGAATEGAGLDGPNRPSSTELTPALVTTLQSVHSYPCVSLLLTTRPGARMEPADAARLEQLRDIALSRLRAEQPADVEQRTLTALDEVIRQATSGPTDHALAVYVGRNLARVVTLPIEVEDRVVIDPTFATRDLVRALHRTPRHVVLVLSAHRAALYDGAGGRLAPAASTQFPMDLGDPDGSATPDDALLAALRSVDLSLGTYLRLHPAPVVVAGPQRIATAFCSVSTNLARLAGTVYGGFEEPDVADLARRIRPVLDRYLRAREHAALALLAERSGAGRVVSGIGPVWLAARTARPEMLLVEEGFRYPARLGPDGRSVTPATDADAPDVIDDLVDELIETVLDRGGLVALARDDALATHDRIALTLP